MKHLLAIFNNTFVSGGLLLMLTGSMIALLRNMPSMLWTKIKNQLMVSVTIMDTDPLFEWITLWLDGHPYTKRARFVMATTKEDRDRNDDGGRKNWNPVVIFSPARGQHFFFYQGKFIWLSRDKADKTDTPAGGDANKSSLLRSPEAYIFRTPGRSQSMIRNLIDDVLKATRKEREEKVAVYTTNYDYWEKLFSYTTRSLDSVILPSGCKESLLEDVKGFLSDRQWYVSRGVPYRRGYLFFGPPGNGKTSLIAALAGHIGLNLYSLNLSNRSINDASLASLVRNVRPNSIFLLEDVDAAVPNREAKDGDGEDEKAESGVTLSGLLNVLDGVLTPDGLMVMMTTNYPERLDPALTRPGRIDQKVEFTFATEQQKIDSFRWFYPDRDQVEAQIFAESLNGHTSMATVQQCLIEMKGKERIPVVD